MAEIGVWLEASKAKKDEGPREGSMQAGDSGGRSPSGCKREACDIQACLQQHDHQQSRCQGAIRALVTCCRSYRAKHGHSNEQCSGIRLDSER
jgi:hypothetical protein